MKSTRTTVLGVIALLLGFSLVFPALAEMRNTGGLATAGVALFVVGLALCLGGGRLALARFASQRGS